MSPIDNHLRDSLTQHAEGVSDDFDRFTAVEQRARAMHRRRVAWASGATAVVLAGGVVGGVTLFGNDRDTVRVPLGNEGSETPTPEPSVSPSPLDTPVPAGTRFLDWPYRSDGNVEALDPAGSVHPLWGGRLPNGTTVLIAQKVDDAGNVRSLAYITEQGHEPYTVDGAALKPAVTNEVSFVLPGDAYPWVLVIGAPGTEQILYETDPGTFEPVETVDGWALFKRTGSGPRSNDSDRIEVLDGNGDLDHPLYYGPIDTGPSEPDV